MSGWALALAASGLLTGLAGCGPGPVKAVSEAFRAAAAGDGAALSKVVDPGYADPLGDRDALLERVEGWAARYHDRELDLFDPAVAYPELSRRRAVVRIDRLEWRASGGGPRFSRLGPAAIELTRDGSWRVVSGLLTTSFDVEERLEEAKAALEANELGRLARLLHPTFRRGPDDEAAFVERLDRLLGSRPVRIERTGTRVEVRDDLVHVDAFARLSVDGGPPASGTLRATLRPVAGRWAAAAVRWSTPEGRSPDDRASP